MKRRDFSHRTQGFEFERPRSAWQRWHIDPWLLLLLLLLCAAGLVVLYSASGMDVQVMIRQLLRLGIAVVVMLWIAQIHPRWFNRWSPVLYALSVLALLAVAWFGVGAKGAQRWLDLPLLPRFQPSEMMKIALPLMLSSYLARRPKPPRLKHIAGSVLIVLLPTLLILRQPDLGTAVLVSASGLLVIYFAGIRWRYLLGGLLSVLALIPVMWIWVMHDYQKQRVLTCLDAESDRLGTGWNIIQSKIAIGSGGLQGKGYLQGTQSQLDFLPESHTDFIAAVIGEEFGLIGLASLVILYSLIALRGMLISLQAHDAYGRLVAGSLTLTFYIYVVVNIGMVTGLLPVVGVPLPMISYGGTSAITLMIGFGILMSISTNRAL